ncbi:Uma2 family endonuclease [Azospirillum doebereinerae]|uniref:Uma2 family endonuclease n=1 Tax=Azospirillum doebereinerae TaxID=92933 RepID=A0A433JEH3_9PROT|nr:Uma2 family endonuclease [Azospirillum doebereinerae]MCG5242193.1 Uma2 family endonuclease [Azospirillum doebereinerae]RUQ75586.1 Uma2 family endonuclease [Azospirillum doebereinerae]
MSELAFKRMTLDEFLVWSDGTDTRYELIDGVPVAMAPSYGAHQIIAGNIGRHIGNALEARPPCHARSEAGILKPNSFRSYFQADLAVTCTPHRHGQYDTPNPVVIVEVLSRSTEDHDRKVKLPVYRAIPSVQEIVLVHSDFLFVEVHRRLDDTRWQSDLLVDSDAVLRLDSVAVEIPLPALYANVELGPDPAG